MSFKIRAIGSGFFGAGASVFAKLALDPNSQVSTWAKDQCYKLQESYFHFCGYMGVLSRGVFLLGMIAMNLAMVATFFEGMIESGSTIVTALATGSNFKFQILIFSKNMLFTEAICYEHLPWRPDEIISDPHLNPLVIPTGNFGGAFIR